jgi:hypothetical protein
LRSVGVLDIVRGSTDSIARKDARWDRCGKAIVLESTLLSMLLLDRVRDIRVWTKVGDLDIGMRAVIKWMRSISARAVAEWVRSIGVLDKVRGSIVRNSNERTRVGDHDSGMRAVTRRDRCGTAIVLECTLRSMLLLDIVRDICVCT